jgi:flagellar hook-associated protein 2
MASVSSLGIGTGVDLQDMLSKILAAERTPITTLNNRIASTNSKISLYGTLNSKLDTLKSAAETWQFPSRLSAVSATSSDTSIVGASANFNATVGSYTMEVTQLASAQKSISAAYSAGTTFGAGELTFTVAGEEKPAIILEAPGGYTLEEVSSRINAAKIGVTATVVTTSSGEQRMVLTGNQSGDGKGFSLASTSAATGSQASLAAFDESTPGLLTSPAQDALMKIDGIEVRSNTNSFTSSITGLTLTAVKQGTSTITVENDKSKITSAVEAFVSAYNEISTLIKSNSNYNSETKTAQVFNGDSSARSVLGILNSARTGTPTELASNSLQALSEIGIVIQQSGQLTLDKSKLEAAIGNSPVAVTNLLEAYGKQFNTAIQGMQSSGGLVSSKIDSLNNSITRFNSNKESLEARLLLVEKRYRAQFTALDKYVSSMQTTSSYLTQQLAGLSAS